MVELKIKQLEKNDIERVKNLVDRCRPYVVPHPDYNYWLLSQYSSEYTVLAEYEGKLVGFVSGFQIHGNPWEMFVIQICTDSDMRGSGIANMLLEELYKRHNKDGKFAVECTISPDNEASRKTFAGFAQSHGGSSEWMDLEFDGSIVERGFRVEIERAF